MTTFTSLTGKTTNTPTIGLGTTPLINLTQSSLPSPVMYVSSGSQIAIDVQSLEILIMDNIILPLVGSQWKTVNENLFLIPILQEKLKRYYAMYGMPELLLYQNILTIYSNVLNEHKTVVDLEKTLIGAGESDDIINVVYKTKMIILKPEYNLYNLIMGVPNFSAAETYDKEIISDIVYLIALDNVSFKIVKDFVLNKYTRSLSSLPSPPTNVTNNNV